MRGKTKSFTLAVFTVFLSLSGVYSTEQDKSMIMKVDEALKMIEMITKQRETGKVLEQFEANKADCKMQDDDDVFDDIDNMIAHKDINLDVNEQRYNNILGRQGNVAAVLKKIYPVQYGDGRVCLFFKGKFGALVCDPECGQRVDVVYDDLHYGLTVGCASDEENNAGSCYKKCSLLTNGNYPLRTAQNTCAKNGCDANQVKDAGLCYPKCKKNYKGVGPICWGDCSHFCPGHRNLGLYCYRWWPPHSCKRPSYGRGEGKLPYEPKTKGFGCNGFGVGREGRCARCDISFKLPQRYKLC